METSPSQGLWLLLHYKSAESILLGSLQLTQVGFAHSIEFFMFGRRITTLGRGQLKRDQSVSVAPDD